MNELAIVGIFYDGYYSIWEDFLELFERNWPDCPYPLYIVNDECELGFEKDYKVTVFHAGYKAEYSQRVQTALKEIDAEYFLLLLEDFFCGRPLDENILKDILQFIITNNIRYYRMPLGEFVPFYKKGKIQKINPTAEYTLSCQPSIWKKEFLQECIGEYVYNAWIFEGIYAKAPVSHTETFLKGCFVDYRNVLGLYHGALQSKLLYTTFKYFQKQGYNFKAKLPIMGKKQEKRHKCKSFIIDITPLWIRNLIKNFKGTNSILDRYTNEIDDLIKKMKLDSLDD